MERTVTALVPVRQGRAMVAAKPAERQRCAGRSGSWLSRVKWAWIGAAVLAAVAFAAGSIWLGFAALVPFLYTLPCLVMLAMCMKKGGGSGSGGNTSS